MDRAVERELKGLSVRLARVESRLVQLMLHLKLDPYSKKYDDCGKLAKPKGKESG